MIIIYVKTDAYIEIEIEMEALEILISNQFIVKHQMSAISVSSKGKFYIRWNDECRDDKIS